MPDKLFMPTHPSSPFSHAYTRTHHQPDSSPPGLAQWPCYIKASAYGSRVGWTPARMIHTYIHIHTQVIQFIFTDRHTHTHTQLDSQTEVPLQ